MRSIAIAVLSWLLVVGISLSGTEARSQAERGQIPLQPSHVSPKIEVKLSLPKSSLETGKPVMLRAEIRNVGDEAIFVPSKFRVNSSGDPGELEISVLGEGLGRRSEGAADRFWPPKEDFFKLVFEYWVVLPPGYSYGTTFDLTKSGVYEFAPPPGRYQIRASYSAYGMSSKNMNNPLGAFLDKVSSLPYESWEGDFKCRPVWFEVTAPRNSSKKP